MQPIVANLAALAVALIYYLWRSHYQTRQRRQRILHQRVAHMLWVMAENVEEVDASFSAS
ncbi:MAG TPA: hypothetical protein VN688_04825 [Gemmataceae bacterium]|nr:hypothetical protein [Gemmataceae bacterium]